MSPVGPAHSKRPTCMRCGVVLVGRLLTHDGPDECIAALRTRLDTSVRERRELQKRVGAAELRVSSTENKLQIEQDNSRRRLTGLNAAMRLGNVEAQLKQHEELFTQVQQRLAFLMSEVSPRAIRIGAA